MNNELTDKAIAEYYSNYFKIDKVMSYIGFADFDHREFGFVVRNRNDPSKEHFIRNISFPTANKLVNYMVNNAVRNAYIGAVYDHPLSNSRPISNKSWIRREFIFDIDIDEYDEVRTCGCHGDQFCVDCWTLVEDAVLFIEETLKEDFGVKEMKWIFSGRRGVHGWVLDKEFQYHNRKIRTAVLNYLDFTHTKNWSQSINEIPNEAKPLRNRIYSIIARSYLTHLSPQEFKAIATETKARLSLDKAKEIINNAKKASSFDHLLYISLLPSNEAFKRKIADNMILYRAPRIDRKVTMDTNRVSRMPYSIHSKTGNIAVEIDDIRKFDPFNVATVWNYVK